MLEKLKKVHRGLLELIVGILFLGLVFLLVGVFLVKAPLLYAISLLIGIITAAVTAYHMYRTLDKALTPGRDSARMISTASLIRYVCIFLVLGIVLLTDKLNPLITFMGVMTLKLGAYLQPFTHKFMNYLFHEVDPIPQPLFDEAAEGIVDDKKE